MVVSDLLAGGAQAATAMLVLTGVAEIWHLVVLQVIRGVAAISRRGLPVALVGAGLPDLQVRLIATKPYADRLFQYRELGRLPDAAARAALVGPAATLGIEYQEKAARQVVRESAGYPYLFRRCFERPARYELDARVHDASGGLGLPLDALSRLAPARLLAQPPRPGLLEDPEAVAEASRVGCNDPVCDLVSLVLQQRRDLVP
jgi:hypothetical protein